MHGGTKPSLGKFRVVYASGLCEEHLSWEEVIASQLRSVIKSFTSLGHNGIWLTLSRVRQWNEFPCALGRGASLAGSIVVFVETC